MWDFLKHAWDTAWTSTQPPVLWTVALLVAAGAALTLLPPVWHRVRHIVTLAHESGHAVVGVLTGRRLTGIKLHSDTSGVTATAGVGWGLSGMLTTLAGYPAPAFVAAMILYGVMSGHANLTAAVICAILLILLLFTRNAWGLLVTLATILVIGAAFTSAPAWVTSFVLLAIVGLLAAGSFRTLLEERESRKSGVEGSDIAALASRTLLPATGWWLLSFGLCAGWLLAAFYVAIL